MISLVEKIKSNRLWRFHGGVHPDQNKNQSADVPLQHFMPTNELILPLKQHMGGEGELIVQVGDTVLKGQPLTRATGLRNVPVHASTSGTITAIEPRVTAHASGLAEMSVVIKPDGEDRWKERTPCSDYSALSRQELITRILDYGIVGLGGAGFSAAMKLNGSMDKVDILIINGAECEPYITADDILMRTHAAEIMQGIRILNHIIKPQMTVIAIEDNKPEAIESLVKEIQEEDNTVVRAIKTLYPSGGKKQLIRVITGNESPAEGRSTDAGAMVQNITTAYAIKRAIMDDEPLVEKIVTLSGDAILKKGNYQMPIGTIASDILFHAHYTPSSETHHIIVGGSMMGFSMPSFDMPIVKVVNALVAPTQQELPPANPELPCIRCSKCADVCPTNLLPQQLLWYAKAQDYEKCQEYFLFDCIECGSCAFECSSEIPLVKYFRQAKAQIWELQQKERDAERAKQRVDAKAARLKRIRDEQVAARKQRNQELAKSRQQSKSNENEATKPAPSIKPIAKETPTFAPMRSSTGINLAPLNRGSAQTKTQTKQSDAVAAAVARAKSKREAAKTEAKTTEPDAPQQDPKKAAVAAAIARAKAKREATKTETESTEQNAPQQDPKKAAVAAAIARAKAKQQAAKLAKKEKE